MFELIDRFQFWDVNRTPGCGLIGCPAELTHTEGKSAGGREIGGIGQGVRGLDKTGGPLQAADIEADAAADIGREPAVGSKIDIAVRQEGVVMLAEIGRAGAGVGRDRKGIRPARRSADS